MAATITATDVVGVWPPRKLITVTGLTAPSYITVNRIVGGARTPLRGATNELIGSSSTVLVDAELPFGLPVTYELIEDSDPPVTDGPATTTLPGGNVALTDATTALASEVVILAHDDLVHDAEATVFQVDGRNYVVSDKIAAPTGTWEFYTETTTAHDDLMTLLRECTSGVMQMRQPGGYAGVDGYYAPLTVSVRRFSQDGSDQRRITAVRMAETTAWHGMLVARGFTLQDVADAYAGLTLADYAADYATLLLAAQGDYS
jgi:hypothetical protein